MRLTWPHAWLALALALHSALLCGASEEAFFRCDARDAVGLRSTGSLLCGSSNARFAVLQLVCDDAWP